MARPSKNVTAEITFGEFVPEEKSNPFAGNVAELAKQDNPNASMIITVDVADAAATQHKIQRAANAIGKTARLRLRDDSAVKVVGTDDDGDEILAGQVRLTFTLTGKHKGKRGPKAEATEAPAE